MSLRTRIVALISALLAISIMLGAVGAGLRARTALREELQAAMHGGAQTVGSAFDDLPRSTHPARDLLRLVGAFDGDRHVVAVLVDPSGRPVARSRPPQPKDRAPGWFRRLIAPAPSAVAFPVPNRAGGFGVFTLEAAPEADLAATWAELSTIVLVLVLSAMAGLTLVYFVVQAALAPLRDLSDSFARIGRGDYRGRVRERGPVEILRLEQSFNEMAERLAAMSKTNRTLETQLLTLQDEERADLARDLHDDIGPHLFAVSLDAQMITQLVRAGRSEEVYGQVESIQATVGRVQRAIREIVGRLRPARVTELGLNRAVLDLVRFWQARRPEIEFQTDLPPAEPGVSDPVKDTAFRVVQEAVNNAVRHARPTRVEVQLARRDHDLTLRISNDGAAEPSVEATSGFGLPGMRERVDSIGGRLTIRKATPTEPSWLVVATLPASEASAAAGGAQAKAAEFWA